ncbi:hypothetical protein [Metamycoplasma buccale]|uniref:hypothetical protein n=1 Tax=Metamycoplasma buccale TaxID=55602 RepID=UPI00398EBFE6
MIKKSLFDKVLNNHVFDEEKLDKEKKEILANKQIKQIITSLKLNKTQISKGMNLLQKYYNFIKQNPTKTPSWSLILNKNNALEIDITNDASFKKQKMYENFWLTDITPLDSDLELYFSMPSKQKPKKILSDANLAMKRFPAALQETIKVITNTNTNQGLFLVDEEFIYGRMILKYLSTLIGTNKDKTVALIDANSLFNSYHTNQRNISESTHITRLLTEVDYLFIDRLGVGTRPEWFINNLITILTSREMNKKSTFINAPIDITLPNCSLISYSKDTSNLGSKKVEDLLKKTIKRTTIKYIAIK